jgi:outer membrane protein
MKILLNILITLLILPLLLSAQEVEKVLSLEECIEVALENNVTINTSRNYAKMAKLGVKGSYSNILPRVNAQLQGGRNKYGESTFLDDVPIGIDSATGEYYYEQRLRTNPAQTRDSYSAGVTISQNIFDGGFWWNDIRRSKLLNSAGQMDLMSSENQVIKTVSQYYYNLLKNIKLLDVYSLAVKRSQDQVDRTQSMYEIGSVAQVDVYRAKVNLGQDKIRYLDQKNTVVQSEQYLNLAMGRDPMTPVKIDTAIVFEPKSVELEDLFNLAEEHQPEIKSRELNVRANELSVAISKYNFWPQIGARFSYSRANEDISKVYSDFNRNWSYSYGVGLSWNLFNGFSDQVNYQTSKIELKNSRISFADYKRTLKSNIRNFYNSYNAIIEIVNINKENLEAAREEYRLANERYRLGSGTALELREAQVNLTEAEQILVAAEYNAIITYIELSETIGMVKEALNM